MQGPCFGVAKRGRDVDSLLGGRSPSTVVGTVVRTPKVAGFYDFQGQMPVGAEPPSNTHGSR
jgi:hypothetical protein